MSPSPTLLNSSNLHTRKKLQSSKTDDSVYHINTKMKMLFVLIFDFWIAKVGTRLNNILNCSRYNEQSNKSSQQSGFYIMERGGDDEWSAWLDYDGDDGPSVLEGSSVDHEQPSMEEGSGDPKQPTQKNTRGRSKRNDITKIVSEGKKLEVEYNNYGQHWGKGATTKLTRIGAWVRTNIPLRDITWPRVSQDLKNQLWEHIKAAFDVPDTDKKLTISKSGDRWKDWKNTLTEGIFTFKDVALHLLEKPPKLYEKIIDLQEWREFVASRLSPEFEVKRKKAQKSRSCNVYSHRTG
ncbi:hypothetical protein CsatA_006001 [Cannabis sativa]